MILLSVALASTLTLTAPENGVQFDPLTPCTREFLGNHDKRVNPIPPVPPLSPEEEKAKAEFEAKHSECIDDGSGSLPKWNRHWKHFIRNEWTEDLFNRCKKESETLRPFKWTADFKPEYFTVEFSETADFAKSFHEKTVHSAIFPHYLKFQRSYFWRVKAKDADGKEVVSDVRSFSTLDGFPRVIGAPQYNWRDIGGGVNADGKRIRQGMIYRMPHPINWGYPLRGEYEPNCPPTLEMLKEFYLDTLGIKSQCDLRGPDEAEEAEKQWKVYRLDKIGVKVVNIPVDPYHLEGYSRPNYAKAIKFFADKDNYPIMYNCAAGADRTGSIGVLLDAILGRTDEQIYDDYEVTTLNWFCPRLRYNAGAREIFEEHFNPKSSKWGKHTIRENAIAYLLNSGVTREDIDAIRKIMIED